MIHHVRWQNHEAERKGCEKIDRGVKRLEMWRVEAHHICMYQNQISTDPLQDLIGNSNVYVDNPPITNSQGGQVGFSQQ